MIADKAELEALCLAVELDVEPAGQGLELVEDGRVGVSELEADGVVALVELDLLRVDAAPSAQSSAPRTHSPNLISRLRESSMTLSMEKALS